MAQKMTDKQERFCVEYVKDFNASRSARDAGYSERSAKEQASVLLTKHNIQERIKQLTKPALKKARVDLQACLDTLSEIMSAGEKDSDKIKSSELLMRYLGAFEKDNKQKGGEIKFIIKPEGEEPEID